MYIDNISNIFKNLNIRDSYSDIVIIGNTVFDIHCDYALHEKREYLKKEDKSLTHNHFFNEILFVKKGELVLGVGDEELHVQSNSFVILPLNVIHSTIFAECEYYSVGIKLKKQKNEGLFGKTYDLFAKMFGAVNIYDRSTSAIEILDKIILLLRERRKLGIWLIRTYLQELILVVGERILQNTLYKTIENEQFILPNLELAINQRINFVDEEVTLKDLAKEFFISERHLSRIIKEQYGVSFQTRKNIIRIERAKKFLTETDMSIDKISQIVFFSTVSNFSNMFKKLVGCSPVEYRMKNRTK